MSDSSLPSDKPDSGCAANVVGSEGIFVGDGLNPAALANSLCYEDSGVVSAPLGEIPEGVTGDRGAVADKDDNSFPYGNDPSTLSHVVLPDGIEWVDRVRGLVRETKTGYFGFVIPNCISSVLEGWKEDAVVESVVQRIR